MIMGSMLTVMASFRHYCWHGGTALARALVPPPRLRPKRVEISATLRSDEGELVTGAEGAEWHRSPLRIPAGSHSLKGRGCAAQHSKLIGTDGLEKELSFKAQGLNLVGR